MTILLDRNLAVSLLPDISPAAARVPGTFLLTICCQEECAISSSREIGYEDLDGQARCRHTGDEADAAHCWRCRRGPDHAGAYGSSGRRFHPRDSHLQIAAPRGSDARRGEFQLQETPNYSYEILFSEIWGKAMTPMTGLVRARSRMDFKNLIRHDGQEFVFVLTGQLTLHCEGRAPITLAAGESAYFDSGMGHVYTSAGDDDARILVVCFGQNLPEIGNTDPAPNPKDDFADGERGNVNAAERL